MTPKIGSSKSGDVTGPTTASERIRETVIGISVHPHAGTSRKAPEKEQPPVPDDIRELRLLLKKINKEVFSEHWPAFLPQLQLALDKHQPGLVNVWPNTIMWVDKDEYNRVSHWYPNVEFQHSATLQRWVDKDATHDHQYSLAVMTTPPSFLVGQETREDWLKHKFHIWALLTAHAPKGMTGKSIITYDTDVKEFHNAARETTALGMEYRYVKYIRNHKHSRRHDRVWQNLPVPGGKPGKDIASDSRWTGSWTWWKMG
ncbi:hypothetical protein B0H13DRAFT_1851032 [Mycena leptocephala]|nr:hypothetical protein B0H13DRAFT_1851032 [Mycena leptocephala]